MLLGMAEPSEETLLWVLGGEVEVFGVRSRPLQYRAFVMICDCVRPGIHHSQEHEADAIPCHY